MVFRYIGVSEILTKKCLDFRNWDFRHFCEMFETWTQRSIFRYIRVSEIQTYKSLDSRSLDFKHLLNYCLLVFADVSRPIYHQIEENWWRTKTFQSVHVIWRKDAFWSIPKKSCCASKTAYFLWITYSAKYFRLTSWLWYSNALRVIREQLIQWFLTNCY